MEQVQGLYADSSAQLSTSPGQPSKTANHVNWSLCVLCQKPEPKTPLVCPAECKLRNTGKGYITLENDLQGFADVDSLPKAICLLSLNDGTGIANTLATNHARWHKSCRDDLNSTKLERAKKRKFAATMVANENSARETDANVDFTTPRLTRSFSFKYDTFSHTCLFCESGSVGDPMSQVCTFGVCAKIRKCAETLQDSEMLGKLSEGDLIAREAKYHARCLVNFYSRAARFRNANDIDDAEPTGSPSVASGIAFAGLVAHMEDIRRNRTVSAIFKLSDLVLLYTGHLEQLGFSHARENSTRLKNRLLNHFPDLVEVPNGPGQTVNLIFDESLSAALNTACRIDADADGLHLLRASEIIRRHMSSCQPFRGTFSSSSQNESVPQSLLALLAMIMYGPITNTAPKSGASVSIAQLVVYNSSKINRSQSRSVNVETLTQSCHLQTVKHNRSYETPLPVYIGLMLHSMTRKRNIIDKMFHLGLCIGYDRVLALSAQIGNSLCAQYIDSGVVCPPSLRHNLFTVAAVDNIDHNPSSTTCKSSFHGTGISLMQNRTIVKQGTKQIKVAIDFSQVAGPKLVQSLPRSYTEVEDCPFRVAEQHVPATPHQGELANLMQLQAGETADLSENDWLDKVLSVISKSASLCAGDSVSWPAYRASTSITDQQQMYPAVVALLPLFREAAHTPSMIHHCMKIICCAVKYLNGTQAPVIAFDQPLYALAKSLQWQDPHFAEDKLVVLLGGLHIEMAAWKTAGDWLNSSGWTDVLVHSGFTTTGSAESFLKCCHVKKTRDAHIVTTAALYILRQQAYQKFCDECFSDDVVPFDQWCKLGQSSSPQFAFWQITMQLELAVLTFIRALRESNFSLYIAALIRLVPWFFALDHVHYARWTSVHIRDMVALPNTQPSVYEEFLNGNFVIQKTERVFSAVSVDQAHEQLNKVIKAEGGAIGLTENDSALRRWMIAGPEVSRMLSDFEHESITVVELNHHEQTDAIQSRFIKCVGALLDTMNHFGNPFSDHSGQLTTLQSKVIAHESVVKTVQDIESFGCKQYTMFVSERLASANVSLSAPLCRNKLPLFSSHLDSKNFKSKQQVLSLKSDCSLFSRLYIASQSRGGDLDTFFEHENHYFPPALSSGGNIRHGCKSDLLKSFEKLQTTVQSDKPVVQCVVLDGSAVVQMLKVSSSVTTFREYAENIFRRHVHAVLRSCLRVDVVFDVYVENSLKRLTRLDRGSGQKRRVLPDCSLPKNWHEFLHVDENKTQLFQYLAVVITELVVEGKTIVATTGTSVLSCPTFPIEDLEPCNHEEADTRMILHALDASHQLDVHGVTDKSIMIRTVDTDVVVLCVSFFTKLHVNELWIAFGVGRSFRYIATHEVARSLGPAACGGLLFFHALTGCDTVSAFFGLGKVTAFDVWMANVNITQVFCDIGNEEVQVDGAAFGAIERFIVSLYDRKSDLVSVNLCRKDLFSRKGRTIENIPPTQNALSLHIRRAVYQSCHVWSHSIEKDIPAVSPADWGWQLSDGSWVPVWITLPQASAVCKELIRCACKKACSGRCKCVSAHLHCTALCACSGSCANKSI